MRITTWVWSIMFAGILLAAFLSAGAPGAAADAPSTALPTATATLTPTPTPTPTTYTLRFPLVYRDYFPPTWYDVTPSSPVWHILATGDTLTDALTGAEILEVRKQVNDNLWTANIAPWPGIRDKTNVARSYFFFDLSGLPDVPEGKVLSATLELYTDMLDSINGDFLLRFHRGTWRQPPTNADWNAFESEPLGVYDTSQWEGPGLDHPILVPLPGLVGQPAPDVLKFVIRGDEETILPPWEDLTARITLRWPIGDNSWVARLHILMGVD